MRKLLCISIIFAYGLVNAQTPSWEWMKTIGGNNEDFGNAICTDVFGNVYVTGFFHSSSINIGSIILSNTNTNPKFFLVKYDPLGNVLWTTTTGETFPGGWAYSLGNSIATDANGNVYVTGYYGNNVKFGSISLPDVPTPNVFVVKYNSQGGVVWAKAAAGSGEERGTHLSVQGGFVFVGGYFQSSSLTLGTTTLNSTSQFQTLFVAKYDTSGNVIWAKAANGSSGSPQLKGLKVNATGNSYIAGSFYGDSLTIDSFILTSIYPNNDDMFLAKYDNSGNAIWANSLGEKGSVDARGLGIDGNSNLYITGIYNGTSITFGSTSLTGNNLIFYAKFNSAGNFQWVKSTGTPNSQKSTKITTDILGNSYIIGEFDPSFVFGGDTLIKSGISQNLFVAKYDSFGNEVWAKSAGGTGTTVGKNIALDNSGSNIFVIGEFVDTLTFFPPLVPTYGNWDVFVAKLNFITGIEEYSSSAINIYPNPLKNNIYIKSNKKIEEIKLYDITGRLIFQDYFSDTYTQINFNDFKSGIYIIELKDKKYKLIKL